jgi:hypothetical protein
MFALTKLIRTGPLLSTGVTCVVGSGGFVGPVLGPPQDAPASAADSAQAADRDRLAPRGRPPVHEMVRDNGGTPCSGAIIHPLRLHWCLSSVDRRCRISGGSICLGRSAKETAGTAIA